MAGERITVTVEAGDVDSVRGAFGVLGDALQMAADFSCDTRCGPDHEAPCKEWHDLARGAILTAKGGAD